MALSTQLVVFAMRLLSLSFSIFRLATSFFFFFFNDTATTEIYTLSLHDALPIYLEVREHLQEERLELWLGLVDLVDEEDRSEEHTSELQSPCNLVCRLLLEKKKKITVAPVHRGRRAGIRTRSRTPACRRGPRTGH